MNDHATESELASCLGLGAVNPVIESWAHKDRVAGEYGSYAREANLVFALGGALELKNRAPLFEADYWRAYKPHGLQDRITRPRVDIWCPRRTGVVPELKELWVEVKLAHLESDSSRIGGQPAMQILWGYAADIYKLAALTSDQRTGDIRCAFVIGLKGSGSEALLEHVSHIPGRQATSITDADRLYSELCEQASLADFLRVLRQHGMRIVIHAAANESHHRIVCACWNQDGFAESTRACKWDEPRL
jgi:hypothetical protein